MELGYFNGKFVSLDEKVIPIDERGHQFGDGVYEVIRVYNGKPFMLDEHLDRLIKSAEAIRLTIHESKDDFRNLIFQGLEKSGIKEAAIYLQITRGIAPRNHLFPDVPVSVSMTVRNAPVVPEEVRNRGAFAITHPDERWENCYIKSLNLLPNILAKQAANDAGCNEAILIRDGFVTECSSSNIFIVKNKEIITTPLNKHILSGITRGVVKILASRLEIPFLERHFTEEDLKEADEVFLTSTISEVLPVVKIDGKLIGNGKPGELTLKLYEEFQRFKSS